MTTRAAIIGVVLLTAGILLWRWSGNGPLRRPVMEGRPINYWLQRMAAGDGRDEICQRLVAIGPRATAPLIAALNDRPSRRLLTLKVKLTNLLRGRVPAVDRWLWRGQWSESWMAAYTLAEMPAAPNIRDALMGSLKQADKKDEDSNIGFYAIEGLKNRYTNDAAIVVPALRRVLGAPHDNIQASAACALPAFGSPAYQTIPDIVALTAAANSYLSERAAVALGKFGPAASNALPAIGLLLTNSHPTVRRAAAVARWKIAPRLGFPEDILRWNMKHASLQERWLASEELWELDHSRRAEAIEGLLGVVQSAPDDTLNGQPFHGPRWGAAESLGRMGADAASASDVLATVARGDADEWMRRKATEACERIERAVSQPGLTNGLSR